MQPTRTHIHTPARSAAGTLGWTAARTPSSRALSDAWNCHEWGRLLPTSSCTADQSALTHTNKGLVSLHVLCALSYHSLTATNFQLHSKSTCTCTHTVSEELVSLHVLCVQLIALWQLPTFSYIANQSALAHTQCQKSWLACVQSQCYGNRLPAI